MKTAKKLLDKYKKPLVDIWNSIPYEDKDNEAFKEYIEKDVAVEIMFIARGAERNKIFSQIFQTEVCSDCWKKIVEVIDENDIL